MKAIFRTNLDEGQRFICGWDNLDSRDFALGDLINFVNSSKTCGFCLQVVQRKIVCGNGYNLPTHTEIELHLPSYERRTIKEWSEWVREHM